MDVELKIRTPNPGELPGDATWSVVTEENNAPTGYICVSVFEGKAWIHELHYWGENPHAVAMLIKQALKQIKSWGYNEVLVNTYNPKVQRMLERHGFKVAQLIMKGDIN